MTQSIYIRIPRTASRSVATALHGSFRKFKHEYAKVIKLERQDWSDVFKFTIVRNPYDRFVSSYYYAGWDKQEDINEWLADGNLDNYNHARFQSPSIKRFFEPQYLYVYDDNDKLMVDYVGKFEQLKEVWTHIATKADVPRFLPQKTPSRTPEARSKILNKRSREILAKFYAEDFKRFGYKT